MNPADKICENPLVICVEIKNTDDADFDGYSQIKIRGNPLDPCHQRSKRLNTDNADLADGRR